MVEDEALSEALGAPAKDEAQCRACSGLLEPAFEAVLMKDVPVTYHRCSSCGSLMLLDPHWLERSYGKVLVPNPDFGALRRTLFVHRFLRRLGGAGILPPSYRSLDFGSGLGTLVRLQRDQGIDAWGYDLYSAPKFAEPYCTRELPEGTFDLVTCIEVLEHTTKPREILQSFRSKLKDHGIVVLSTELLDRPDPQNWHYLALEHGQHVTLFSQAGLTTAAEAAGFDWIRSVAFEKIPFLHLLVPKGGTPRAWKLLRLRLQQWFGEANYASDRRV